MKQRGFTLIELIIVIIILGILAVTAAPRFFDFAGDARESALRGAGGAINGSLQVVYARAAINGDQAAATGTAGNVDIAYGYPQATSAAIQAAANLDPNEWQLTTGIVTTQLATNSTADDLWVQPEGVDTVVAGTEEADLCGLLYREAADATTPPVIITYADGC